MIKKNDEKREERQVVVAEATMDSGRRVLNATMACMYGYGMLWLWHVIGMERQAAG